MKITFEAKTADELREQIMDMANLFGPTPQTVNATPTFQKQIDDCMESIRKDNPEIPPAVSKPKAEATPEDKKIRINKNPPAKKRGAKGFDAIASDDEPEDDAPALEVVEAGEDEAEEPAKPTITVPASDHVKALQEVNATKGIEAARKVLSEFGVTRISQVEPKKYAAFVKACKAIIAEGE